jgi:signal transduction histidine kinase
MYRGQQLDAIDTRWVFRGYAVLTGLAGLLLLLGNPDWFGAATTATGWDRAALIRVLGSILLAAACCAAGFAVVDPPPARRRALLWFIAAHTIVWLVVSSQQMAVWGPGPAESAGRILFAVVFTLSYLWVTSEGEYLPKPLISVFGAVPPDAGERLRSQYEQQIREVAKQEERNRLARDLHDSIKQQVFVIQTAAATAQTRFDGDPAGAKAALEQVRASAREAMTEMQVMLDQLRAVPLENASLIEALRKHCEALGFRTGARVEFKPGNLPPASALPPGAHEAILRAAQEALANVGRHARANNVLVLLGAAQGHVELRVQDDGSGFDPEHAPRGQGIANMHARAEEFGGEFELISRPNAGTSIAFSLPFASGETPQEYRKKALRWGALLLLLVLLQVWKKSLLIGAPSIAAIFFLRYLVARHRAQASQEAC